jgi:hypothetical protein
MAIDSSEADPLEIIKVVFEFPDVFPKDLPGMPPEQKVEFAIELLPGTAPRAPLPEPVPEPVPRQPRAPRGLHGSCALGTCSVLPRVRP